MNCQELLDYLLERKHRFDDLTVIPVMYLNVEKGDLVAYQCDKSDITIVNVAEANRYEYPIMKTQFENALVIGWIPQIDLDE